MIKRLVLEIIGWYGTIAILLAYALISFGTLKPNNLVYQILNGTGAIGIALNALSRHAYPPATLNLIWSIIAIIALLRLVF